MVRRKGSFTGILSLLRCWGFRCLIVVLLGSSAAVVGQTPSPTPQATTGSPQTSVPTLTMTPTATAIPSPPTTIEPTSSTEVPTFGPRECWDNFTEVYFDLERKLPFSSNTYVICPNRTYDIGYKYDNSKCCDNGDLPIVCRANTHFQCGSDGSSRNSCVLQGGSDHVVYNDIIFGEELTGVILQGFTFRSPATRTMVGVGGGDITYKDCIFEDQQNGGPILTVFLPTETRRRRLTPEGLTEIGDTPWERLEYVHRDEYLKGLLTDAEAAKVAAAADPNSTMEGDGRRLQTADILSMTFEDCIFQNCSQGDFGDSYSTYGLITALSDANVISVKNCIFAYNVYNGQTPYGTTGYAISVHQSDLLVSNSCFLDNDFAGYGTIEVFDQSAYIQLNNYLTGNISALKCPFIAYSDFLPTTPLNDTTCLAANATSCQSTIYETWKNSMSRETPAPSVPSPPSPPTASRPTIAPRPTREPSPATSSAGDRRGFLLGWLAMLAAVATVGWRL